MLRLQEGKFSYTFCRHLFSIESKCLPQIGFTVKPTQPGPPNINFFKQSQDNFKGFLTSKLLVRNQGPLIKNADSFVLNLSFD